MIPRIMIHSSYILFLVLCTQNSLAHILPKPLGVSVDSEPVAVTNNCMVVEEVTETAKIVEDVVTVIFNESLPDVTVKYGQHLKLICDIHISSPMNKIIWRGRFKKYTHGLSEDSREFDIKSVNMEYFGEYITCEATLVSDPKNKIMYGANIIINDLSLPVISSLTPKNATVMENHNMTLTCKIVKGIPQPEVSWQMKGVGDKKFRDLAITGESIIIENASFEDAGLYQCTAKNHNGKATKTTELFVQKAPLATIENGLEKTFPYGNTTEFTCLVKGYPLPNTEWTDSQGNKVNSEDTIISWHEKISKIKLQKLKKSSNYTCIAKNTLGTAMSGINVTVLSPFVVHQHPEVTENVHYGAITDIICNITSDFPIRTKWFHKTNSTEILQIRYLKKNASHAISTDETRLTINSMGFNTVGNYTCEVSLVSDENEKIAFTTNMQIDNLAAPMLSHASKIIVMESNWITLFCKISGGVPRPTMSWSAKRHGETEFTQLAVSSEDLDIENITISEAGQYRCMALNPIGEIFQDTDVIVRKAPVTLIEEGSSISVPYGSDNTFTCNVVAYPLPSIAWSETKGELSGFKEHIIHEHLKSSNITVAKITADNTYSCLAKNRLGEDQSSIHVKVLSPFIVHEHPAVTTYVHYEASKTLICNITTSFPMRIKWFYNSSEIHSSDDYTISSDETKLDIKSVNLELIGNYTCEAYLVDDIHVNEVFTTDLQIDDLRPPVITSYTGEGSTVTAKNLEELSLTCTATGNPTPVVTWQLHSSYVSTLDLGTGETICSTNIGSEYAGTYECTASNIVGSGKRTINVIVV